MANDASVHGYAWPDGTIRTAAYEPGVRAIVKNDNDGVRLTDKPYEPLRTTPHVTQETLDKAYADWLKSYTEWKKVYAAWEAKYGKR